MTFFARQKYARIGPQKTRLVIDMVRGKSVNDALRILKAVNKKASPLIKKVLDSAVANAKQQSDSPINVNNLFIKEARVDGGPVLRRYRPGPMGRAMRIRKRTSHIHIVLGIKTTEAKTEKPVTAKTGAAQPQIAAKPVEAKPEAKKEEKK